MKRKPPKWHTVVLTALLAGLAGLAATPGALPLVVAAPLDAAVRAAAGAMAE